MSKLKPRMSEILDEFQFKVQHRIFTALAAKVTKYNGRTADLEILQIFPGEEQIICIGVPVVQLSTQAVRISIGLAEGDEGLVVFHMRDHTDVLRLNQAMVIKNFREHGLYAEFIPRRVSAQTEWPSYPEPNEIVIGDFNEGTEIRLDVDAGEVSIVASKVNLTSTAPSDAMALASLVDQLFSTLKTAVASGLTAVGVGVAANGPAGATAFNAAFVPTSVASNVIKGA